MSSSGKKLRPGSFSSKHGRKSSPLNDQTFEEDNVYVDVDSPNTKPRHSILFSFSDTNKVKPMEDQPPSRNESNRSLLDSPSVVEHGFTDITGPIRQAPAPPQLELDKTTMNGAVKRSSDSDRSSTEGTPLLPPSGAPTPMLDGKVALKIDFTTRPSQEPADIDKAETSEMDVLRPRAPSGLDIPRNSEPNTVTQLESDEDSSSDDDITFNAQNVRWFGNQMMRGQIYTEMEEEAATAAPGLGQLNVGDIKKAFQGIKETDKIKKNIWLEHTHMSIDAKEGLDEMRRMYSALKFLIHEQNLEDRLEEAEDNNATHAVDEPFANKEEKVDTSNSFLSQTREKARYYRVLEAQAKADAEEEDDEDEEEEQPEDDEQEVAETTSLAPAGALSEKPAEISEQEMEEMRNRSASHGRKHSRGSSIGRRRSLVSHARKSMVETRKHKNLLHVFPTEDVGDDPDEIKFIHETSLNPETPASPGTDKPKADNDVRSLGEELVEEKVEQLSVNLADIKIEMPSHKKRPSALAMVTQAIRPRNKTPSPRGVDLPRTTFSSPRGSSPNRQASPNGISGTPRSSQPRTSKPHSSKNMASGSSGALLTARMTGGSTNTRDSELEAPLDRAILKIDMSQFDKFVPDVLHRQEHKKFSQVWQSIGDAMPVLSKLEAKSYRELLQLMERFCSSPAGKMPLRPPEKGDPPIYGHLEHSICIQIKGMLRYFREIEINPKTWHPGGFLNRIDNTLAILLYRREGSDEGDDEEDKSEKREMVRELPNNEKFARLLAEMQPRKCPRVLKYLPAVVVMLLLFVGIYVLWYTWHYQSLDFVYDSGVLLAVQVRAFGESTFRNEFIRGALVVGRQYQYMALEADLGLPGCWSDSAAPSCLMGSFSIDPLLDGTASGVTVLSKDGLMLEAWRRGDASPFAPVQLNWLDSTNPDANCSLAVVRTMDQAHALANGSLTMSELRSSGSAPLPNCAGPALNRPGPAAWWQLASSNTSRLHWTAAYDWPSNIPNPVADHLQIITLVVPLLPPLGANNATNSTSLEGIVALHLGIEMYQELLQEVKDSRSVASARNGAYLQLIQGGSASVLLEFTYQDAAEPKPTVLENAFKEASQDTQSFTKQAVTPVEHARNFFKENVRKNDEAIWTVSKPVALDLQDDFDAATTNDWYIVAIVPLNSHYDRVLRNDIWTYVCQAILCVTSGFLAYEAFKKKTIYVRSPHINNVARNSMLKRRRTVRELLKEKPHYNSIILVASLVIISITMVTVTFYVWMGSVEYQASIERQGFYEAQLEVRQEVERMLSVPPAVNTRLLRFWERRLINDTFDERVLYDVLLEHEPPNGVKRAMVEHAYIGWANGDFIGAQLTHRDGEEGGGEVAITVKDSSTTPTPNCLTKYVARNNGLRDTANVLWVNGDCTYDPRKRPYYKIAQEAFSQHTPGKGLPMRWTPIFSFSSGGADAENDNLGAKDLGITAVLPFTSRDNASEMAGVFAVDMSLGVLNERMVMLNERMNELFDGLKVMVVARDGTVVSSSRHVKEDGKQVLVPYYFQEQIDRIIIPMKGTQSKDDIVNQTVYFLTNPPNNLRTQKDSALLRRPLSAPDTGVLGVTPEGGAGLEWVTILVNPIPSPTEQIENLAWILSFGIVIILIYITLKALKQIQRKFMFAKDHKENALRILGGQKVRKQDLTQLMKMIRPTILRSANNHPDCPSNQQAPFTAINYDDVHKHYTNMAIQHIRDCRKKRNILTLASLHDYDSEWPLFLYRWYTRSRYKFFIYMVCIAHAALVLWKPPTPELMRQEGLPSWILFLDFSFCIIEGVDCMLKLLMIYKWEMDNILSPKGEAFDTITRLILVGLIFADCCLSAGARMSIQYIFPLRPWMIVLKNSYLRKAGSNFYETLSKAGSVMLMYLMLVVCGSVIGIPLLRSIFSNTLADGRVAVFVPAPSFQNFFTALTTIFVFVTTAENYLDLVYPPLSVSSWFAIYFILLVLVGMFFVLALVIGVFQEGFRTAREKVAQKRALFKRTGHVSAFVLLDLHMEGSISQDYFEEFLIARAPQLKHDRTPLEAITLMLNKRSKLERIDLSDFVIGNEMLAQEKRKYNSKIKPWKLQLQAFFDKEWFRTCVVAVVLLHLWVLCLYGTFKNEMILDFIQACILGLYVLELVAKLVAFTFNRFWNSALYMIESGSSSWVTKAKQLRAQMRQVNQMSRNPGQMVSSRNESSPTMSNGGGPTPIPIMKAGLSNPMEFQQIQQERKEQQRRAYLVMFAHRVDFVLIFGCAVTIAFLGFFDLVLKNDNIGPDTYRFVASLTILRIFTLFTPLRRLAYGLAQAFPTLWPLAALAFIVFYVYAIIGVSIFYQEFKILQGLSPQGNFDNIGDGILLLFQMFISESWQDVMYAGVNVRGWTSSSYFITFVILVSVLFGNLFTALFLDLRLDQDDDDAI
eukprot:g35404.t1